MDNWTNTFGSFINKLTQRKKLFDLHHQDGETVKVASTMRIVSLKKKASAFASMTYANSWT